MLRPSGKHLLAVSFSLLLTWWQFREKKRFTKEVFDINDPLLVEGPSLGAHTGRIKYAVTPLTACNDITVLWFHSDSALDITAGSGPEMIQNRLSREIIEKYHTPEYRFRIVK